MARKGKYGLDITTHVDRKELDSLIELTDRLQNQDLDITVRTKDSDLRELEQSLKAVEQQTSRIQKLFKNLGINTNASFKQLNDAFNNLQVGKTGLRSVQEATKFLQQQSDLIRQNQSEIAKAFAQHGTSYGRYIQNSFKDTGNNTFEFLVTDAKDTVTKVQAVFKDFDQIATSKSKVFSSDSALKTLQKAMDANLGDTARVKALQNALENLKNVLNQPFNSDTFDTLAAALSTAEADVRRTMSFLKKAKGQLEKIQLINQDSNDSINKDKTLQGNASVTALQQVATSQMERLQEQYNQLASDTGSLTTKNIELFNAIASGAQQSANALQKYLRSQSTYGIDAMVKEKQKYDDLLIGPSGNIFSGNLDIVDEPVRAYINAVRQLQSQLSSASADSSLQSGYAEIAANVEQLRVEAEKTVKALEPSIKSVEQYATRIQNLFNSLGISADSDIEKLKQLSTEFQNFQLQQSTLQTTQGANDLLKNMTDLVSKNQSVIAEAFARQNQTYGKYIQDSFRETGNNTFEFLVTDAKNTVTKVSSVFKDFDKISTSKSKYFSSTSSEKVLTNAIDAGLGNVERVQKLQQAYNALQDALKGDINSEQFTRLSNALQQAEEDVRAALPFFKKATEQIDKINNVNQTNNSAIAGNQTLQSSASIIRLQEVTNAHVLRLQDAYNNLANGSVTLNAQSKTLFNTIVSGAQQSVNALQKLINQQSTYGITAMKSEQRKYTDLLASWSGGSGVSGGSVQKYIEAMQQLQLQISKAIADPSLQQGYAEVAANVKKLRVEAESAIKTYNTLSSSCEEFVASAGVRIDTSSIDKLKTSLEQVVLAQDRYKDKEINFTGFDASKKTIDYDVYDKATNSIQKCRVQVDDYQNSVWLTKDAVESYGASAQTAFNNSGNAIRDVVTQFLSLYTVIEQLRNGWQVISDIDAALTELRKVTDETDATYSQFLADMSTAAKEVGSTITDLTNSAADWARLGYSIQEAAELAKNTQILMNVSEFENVSDATDSLISTLQAFKTAETDVASYSMQIIDAYNEVGNNFAISTSDLAESLTKSSAALVAAGSSLEGAIGLTTAANTIIQDPVSVGNALKVLSMRVRGVTTELEEMGEDTAGVVTNTAKLQEIIRGLTKTIDNPDGINILNDDNTSFKALERLLIESGKVWDQMDDLSRASLLETLAGKQRGSVMAALLDNPELIAEAMEAAANSTGSAQSELNKYLDSIEGKMNQLQTATETFWMNMISSDFAKFLVDTATSVVDLASKFGLLGAAVAGVSVYFGMIKRESPVAALQQIMSSITKLSSQTNILNAISATNKKNNLFGPNVQSMGSGVKNLLAAQLSGYTAEVQAAKLATMGLTEAQALAVLQTNKIKTEDAAAAIAKANFTRVIGDQTHATLKSIRTMDFASIGFEDQNAIVQYLENNYDQLSLAVSDASLKTAGFSSAQGSALRSMLGMSTVLDRLKAGFAGLTAAVAANPIGAIITAVTIAYTVFQGVSSAIEEQREQIAQASTDAIKNYNEAANSLKTFGYEVETLENKYNRLSQGTAADGSNISLTTDEYQEYRDVVNQIAEQIPSLVSYYNLQGDAVLNLKGNVLDLTEAMREQQALNAQSLWAERDTVSQSTKNTLNPEGWLDSYNDSLESQYRSAKIFIDYLNGSIESFSGDFETFNIQMWMSDLGIELVDEQGDYTSLEDAYNRASEEQQRALIEQAESIIQSANESASEVQSLLAIYPASLFGNFTTEAGRSFNALDSELQNIVSNFAQSIDLSTLYKYDYNAEDVARNVIDPFINALSSHQDEFNLMQTMSEQFFSGDISVAEYETAKKNFTDFLGTITDDEDTRALISVAFQVDETTDASIQQLKEHAQSLLADGEDGAFISDLTYSQLQKLQEISTGTTMSASEVWMYANAVSELGEYATRTYESLSGLQSQAEAIASSTDVLNEAIANGTKLSDEYVDVLKSIVADEDELNEVIDTNNENTIKNVDALHDLIDAKKKDTLETTRNAKAAAQARYSDLVSQLGDIVNSTNNWNATSQDAINTLIDQINSVESVISQYSRLEEQLLGTTNAFTQFQNASTIDEANTYGSDYVSMVQTIYDTLEKNGDVGSAKFLAALEIVPDSIYKGIDDSNEQLEAIYNYLHDNLMKGLSFDSDSELFSIDADDIESFLKKALDTGVLEGTLTDFAVNQRMGWEEVVKTMGEKYNMTETQLYAMFSEASKYTYENGENIDFLSEFDKSIDGTAHKIEQALADLYEQKNQLLRDGGESDALDSLNQQIAEANANLQKQQMLAYDNVKAYSNYEIGLAGLQEILNQTDSQTKLLTDDLKEFYSQEYGINFDTAGIITVQGLYDYLLSQQLQLEQPTVMTAQLATAGIDTEIGYLQNIIDNWSGPENKPVSVTIDGEQFYLTQAEIQGKINELSEDKVTITADYDLQSNDESVQEQLNGIQQFTIGDKTFSVVLSQQSYNNTMSRLRSIQSMVSGMTSKKTVTITTIHRAVTQSITARAKADGTFHGSARAGGYIGLRQAERRSLVGELGRETVVDPRSGRYYTVGDNGAELVDLPKGAIIFNHLQTEDLFSKGYINSRGAAYLEGNAHATVWRPRGSSDRGSSGSSGSGSSSSSRPSSKPSSSSSSSTDDNFEETFDWLVVRLSIINGALEELASRLKTVVSEGSKKFIMNERLKQTREEIETLTEGIKLYESYAQKLLKKIPSEYRNDAQNGAIAIEDFVGDADESTLEAIKNYREWADKVADLKTQLNDATLALAELRQESLELIETKYTQKNSPFETRNEQIEAYIDYLEESGERASEAMYQQLISNSTSMLENLKKQRTEMQKELDAAVKSGDVKKYSDTWYEMVESIHDTDAAIQEARTSIEEYSNAINEIHWSDFDAVTESLSNLNDRIDSIRDLLDSDNSIDEFGEWTEDGLTALGLLAQQMELAEYESQEYAKQIDYLNEQYKQGKYSTDEYNKKLQELKDGQLDSIQNYNDARDAIIDLNKERVEAVKDGIQKEIDAYSELIEKKKEDLSATKDAHDYEKNVADKQSNISNIQRQIDALIGDDSASANAKRRKLQQELLDAQEELDELYYDHSIEMQQDQLDRSLASFEDEKNNQISEWDEYLANEEAVLDESLQQVQTHAETIGETLAQLSEQYGIQIESAITEPWNSGVNAIDAYDTRLSVASSDFIQHINDIKDALNDLRSEAESGADAVIDDINRNSGDPIPDVHDTGGLLIPEIGEISIDDQDSMSDSTKYGKVSGVKATLSMGSSGNDVKKLQYALKSLGYKGKNGKSISIDGSFGANTKYAVQQFQKKSGLTQDGVVGTNTKKKFKAAGYAIGSKNILSDQLAYIDENGLEELVLHADNNGRLAYLTKGSGVVPANLTSNLMEWGKLDPTQMLKDNMPRLALDTPKVLSTVNGVTMNISEVVHIDKADNSSVQNIANAVHTEMDNYMRQVNQSLRRFTR